MFSFLNNIPQVTKNLLILNVLMFIITLFLETRGVDLRGILGAYPVNSPMFQPYQVISNMFMHGNLGHLVFNMFALVMFGGFLERLWGARRFFIFYMAAGIGAFVLEAGIDFIHLYNLKQELAASGFGAEGITELNAYIKSDPHFYFHVTGAGSEHVNALLKNYMDVCMTPSIGASGAIFGLLAAFAILFPNTPLMIIFFPVPIKAKYLVGGYFIIEVILSFYTVEGDNVAHLAHLGGAIVGAILVLFWRRNSNHFY